ncbi:hypothetical protein sos41_13830 [Alphaproteobacteria bacterium SO-S41]|nr:hypothetical protein sos41_13830 [Alphaproteobacteria bacterium SO-S41]
MAPEDDAHDLPGLRDAQGAVFAVDAKAEKPASPHAGHRERLRARFMAAGAEALADHEMIELLLFGALPRIDTKPLAKTLIERFGSYEEVLAAPPERLRAIKGMSDGAVALLKTVEAAAIRLARKSVQTKPVISSWTALLDYCKAAIARAPVEQFRLLLLDRKNRLIEDAVMAEGTIDHTPVYPREIVKRALEAGASAMILVHNHPSGDPTPSRADIEMTKAIAAAAKPLGVAVHDHLVIGRGGHASFKELGLL